METKTESDYMHWVSHIFGIVLQYEKTVSVGLTSNLRN